MNGNRWENLIKSHPGTILSAVHWASVCVFGCVLWQWQTREWSQRDIFLRRFYIADGYNAVAIHHLCGLFIARFSTNTNRHCMTKRTTEERIFECSADARITRPCPLASKHKWKCLLLNTNLSTEEKWRLMELAFVRRVGRWVCWVHRLEKLVYE